MKSTSAEERQREEAEEKSTADGQRHCGICVGRKGEPPSGGRSGGRGEGRRREAPRKRPRRHTSVFVEMRSEGSRGGVGGAVGVDD